MKKTASNWLKFENRTRPFNELVMSNILIFQSEKRFSFLKQLKKWSLIIVLLALSTNLFSQQTQVYWIETADLVDLPNVCNANNQYGSGATIGFDWTDVLPTYAILNSVTVEFVIGVECAASTKTTTLNGVSQGSITTTNQCTCTPTTITLQSPTINVSDYVLGGTNSFRIPSATTGLNNEHATLNGYWAKITLDYSTFSGPVPTITSFSPSSGDACQSLVTINGTNFDNGTPIVKFNGIVASSTYVGPTQLTATVPMGATSGNITVQTGGGIATSPTSFTVNTPAAPTITALSTSNGTRGTIISIIGTDLFCASDVSFGGTPAFSYTVVSSTQIDAEVGYGTSGDVSVTTGGGTATFSGFNYTAPTSSTQVTVSGSASVNTISNNTASIVDDAVTVTANGTITGFTVSITGSYTAGDILSYNGSLPAGITVSSFNTTTRSIVFSGSLIAEDWQDVLRNVQLTTSSATCYPESRTVTFIAGDFYYNPLNGHFYKTDNNPTSWTASNTSASNSSYFGRQGYLATITSPAENSFVSVLLGQNTWVGGSDNFVLINEALGYDLYANQAAAEGKFYWVTGPEVGTQLTTANGSGGYIAGVYQNWGGSEPNNSSSYNDPLLTGVSGGEYYIHLYTSGLWNDFADNQSIGSIIEYGGLPQDNLASTPTFDRNIYVTGAPTAGISGGNVSVCSGTNSTTLSLDGFSGTVVRWESSLDNFLSGSYTTISNTTTSLTVTNITETTYYRAIVNTGSCTNIATSPTTITIQSTIAGNINSENSTICSGGDAILNLYGNIGDVLNWQMSTSSTFSSGNTTINNTTTSLTQVLSTPGTYYFRAQVQSSCGSAEYTSGYPITVTNGTPPVGGTVSSESSCSPASGTLTLSGHSGTVQKWQYLEDGNVVWVDVVNTTTSLTYSGLTISRTYRAELTNGTCGTAYSTGGQVTVIADTDPVTPTLADVTGECSATATVPTTTDECSGTITGTTSDPLTYNTQGTHVIAWTFDDGNGNSITVNQNVIIDDITDPVTPTLADITGECSATATAPTTTDACAGTITGTTSDPLTYNTQGTHVIAWTFDDGNGNSIVVNQNVIIDDVTDPVTPTLADITGECSATATAPTTTDACAGTITGTTSDPLTYNTQGTHVIAWTFDDGNGNSIVVNQNVIIDDITDPVTPTLADITGECSATATAPTTTDACAGTITGTTSDPLTYNTQGTHVIAWTFDDGNGNSIVVNQNVIIDDITDPVTPTLADITGECSATATAPTTTDACAGTITGTTSDPLTYNTQGTHVIAWTFDDGNGNSIVVNQNVIIDDITDPVTPTLADITGECSATATAPTTTDACAGTITGTTSDPLTYNTQGTHVIAWTFDDGNGNSIVVNQNVIVNDVTDPVTPTLADITGECSATATAPTTTDACAGTITGTTSDPLTYNTQGTHVIAWTFDDGNGNSIVVNQNVIIDDVTDPVTPTLADITGECSATATAPTTTDACAGTITGTTSDPLTYNTQGTHVIAWTFDDGNGNSIVVNQNVIIDDITDPVTPTLADITGECSATATAPTTTDACAGTITGTTSDPLTYNTQGTHVIAWTFDDGNGNSIVVNQNVIIDDITDPVTPTLADVTGECSATATAPTTTDACAGTITGTTSDPLTYNTQGTHVIAWTFDDGNGNSIVVNQNVIIDDVTDPVIPTLADITGECSATATAPTTTDACAGTITGTTSDPLTYNTQGTHVIAWTFDDGNGNSIVVNQNVIIDDITDPVTPTLANVTGECSATATAPTTTDACAGTITGTTSDPLTYNTQGTHVIAWTFDDGNGNSIVVNQNVIVNDVTDPVTPTLADVTGECSATATAPTTTDACAGTITGTTSDPLTYNTQGTHVIAWTFDDGNGNSIVVNQNVIINDISSPVVDVTDLPTVNEECSATLTAPTATDNCDGMVTATTTTVFPVTTSETITWTYTDMSGNISTQNQEVVIEDITAPLADVTDLPTVNEECSATLIAPTATDNCEGTITATTTTVFPVTTSETITWTYTDMSGNISTQNQEVVIEDITAPLADVTDLPTVNDECSATLIAPTATDNCEGTITATTTTAFPVTASETITWTYTDMSGNISTQTQEVVIEDITDPTITCPANFSVMADDNGNTYTVPGTDLDPLAIDDNCGVASAYNSVNMGSSLMGEVFNLGTTTVNWTVEDISGRLATCSFDLTIDEFVGIEEIFNTTNLTFRPNPTHGQITINYKSNYQGSVKVKVVDMSGREVFIEKFNKTSEELNEELNLNGLSTGAYYLVIQTEKHTITRKLIRSDK